MTASEGSAFDIRIRSVRLVRRVEKGAPFVPRGLLPVLGLATLLVFGLTTFAGGAVESVAARTAREALDGIGATWGRVSVSGQWVMLSGTPPSQAEAVEAVETVRQAKARALITLASPITKVSQTFAAPKEATASPDPVTTADPTRASASAGMCGRAFAGLLGAKNIEFVLGSAELGKDASTFLDAIVRVANNCPGVLAIQGYTDSSGSDAFNVALSRRRAEAVRTALIARGLPAERLVAEGRGANDPVASNRTETGRDRNRRIEILVQAPEN